MHDVDIPQTPYLKCTYHLNKSYNKNKQVKLNRKIKHLNIKEMTTTESINLNQGPQ